ncbi:unnamed protein product [Ectocarpus sp. 8 AP-2014]
MRHSPGTAPKSRGMDGRKQMNLFQVVCIGLLATVTRSQELQSCSVDNSRLSVGSTEDAATLAIALECSNGDFDVQWVGDVFVAQTIRVTNGTSLNITGAGPGAIADGRDATQLFVVDGGSRLHLSGMSLIHGNASLGGAVSLSQSRFSFRNTWFVYNSAAIGGGAIFAWESTVSWDGDGTQFIANSAQNADDSGGAGGAIFMVENSNVSWVGNDTLFFYNSASHGGAIYANSSTVYWDGDGTNFSYNFAHNAIDSGTGGAIFMVDNSSVSWVGNDTQFIYNDAVGGGAIFAWESTVSWHGGSTNISYNVAAGGASVIYALESTVYWDGDDTHIDSNFGAIFLLGSTLSWDGDNTHFGSNTYLGVIRATGGSTVSWDGDNTHFINNSAFFGEGAAIAAEESTVYWDGDGTQFSFNSASGGGAISAMNKSSVSWDGDRTNFSSNAADCFLIECAGGSISAYDSTVSWHGDGTKFSYNVASDRGGAIFAVDKSTLSWHGNGTNFSYNVASEHGGAIYADYSSVSWNGTTEFTRNIAGINGGALAMEFGIEHLGSDTDDFFWVKTDGLLFVNTTFIENNATFGGAVYLFNIVALYFWDAIFQSNSASSGGGAVAAYSAGDESHPILFENCTFSNNTANGPGGAVLTVAGYQEFVYEELGRYCQFESNYADSGGAMSLGGTTVLSGASFVSNSASTRGPAIAAVGVVDLSGLTFDGNDFFCDVGSYLRHSTEGEPAELFGRVCFDCGDFEDDCPFCYMKGGNAMPACEAPLEHTTATEPGTTVETLVINEGYWRASTKSNNILACYNEEACIGGQTGAYSFCAPGYNGPYCDVCDSDYSPSLAHTCTRCSSSRRHGFMSAAVIAALLVCIAIVKFVQYLWSTELGEENVRGFHQRVLRAVPVQALKIIVVAWQILTQFADATNVTFPGVYQDFLNLINVINFDLGSVLAAGCLWPEMDFHDRLLVSTMGPLVVVGFLVMMERIAVGRNISGDTAVLQRIRHKYLTALLLWTFLIYSSVSTTVFQTFACEKLDDGVEYLRADYSIQCSDVKHKGLEVYAGFMVIVYPVGIPLLYAFLLFQHRDVLAVAGADKEEAQPIAGLWETYRPERFYYEVVECGRRIMLTGVVVFIFPNDAAQIAITLLITVCFSWLFEVLSPYQSESDMWLSRGAHAMVFFSMFDALLLKVDVSEESSESQAVFAGVFVAGHVLMVLAIVVEVVGICYASRRKQAVEDTVSSAIPSPGSRTMPAFDSAVTGVVVT